jgi:hypothetical protein
MLLVTERRSFPSTGFVGERHELLYQIFRVRARYAGMNRPSSALSRTMGSIPLFGPAFTPAERCPGVSSGRTFKLQTGQTQSGHFASWEPSEKVTDGLNAPEEPQKQITDGSKAPEGPPEQNTDGLQAPWELPEQNTDGLETPEGLPEQITDRFLESGVSPERFTDRFSRVRGSPERLADPFSRVGVVPERFTGPFANAGKPIGDDRRCFANPVNGLTLHPS